jgi:hypothetical protein
MRRWANNALTQLSANTSPSATTIAVSDRSTLPDQVVSGFDFGKGDYYLLTIKESITASTPNEIVKVTGSPSTNVYTVERAQEGTSAQSWNAGATLAGQLTAEAVNAFEQGTGDADTVITDGSLDGDGSAGDPLGVNFGPNTFGLGGDSVLLDSADDLDEIKQTGWYHWRDNDRPDNVPASANRGSIYHNEAGPATSQIVVDAFANKYHRIRNLAGTGYSSWQRSLRSVVSNNTLVGQGTQSSPLGVNADVFDTQINTDGTLRGDGTPQDLLGVSAPYLILQASETPHTLVVNDVPDNCVIILQDASSAAFSPQTINFEFSGALGGSTSDPIGHKTFYVWSRGVDEPDAAAGPVIQLREGNLTAMILSSVGREPNIESASGLVTIKAVLDITSLPRQYLVISGNVVDGS